MRIISWDVGIKNLAYCVIDYDKTDNNYKIIDWDILNLIEKPELKCCGQLKSKAKNSCERICGKMCQWQLLHDGNIIGFCSRHLSSADKYETKIIECDDKCKCDYIKTTEDTQTGESTSTKCTTRSSYLCDNLHYCKTHKKQIEKIYSVKQIKRKKCNDYSTAELYELMVRKLDSISENLRKFDIEHVIIENQPSFKNPKMKSIAVALYSYFLIRGKVDMIFGSSINKIKMINPSNKLKIKDDAAAKILSETPANKIYKVTKDLGKEYAKELIKNDQDALDLLNNHKKKDDLCDCFLQGVVYIKSGKYAEK